MLELWALNLFQKKNKYDSLSKESLFLLEENMSRKLAREKAYQILFGVNFNDETSQIKISLNEMQKEWNLNEEDLKFLEELLDGVLTNKEELLKVLKQNLKDYKIEQLYASDKAVLLIAIFELLHTQTPQKIVINEAVEISKKYGIEKSSKFVNGVLSGVIKNL